MGKGSRSEESVVKVPPGESEALAAWLLGTNKLAIQPIALPPLGANDVKIRMKAVGICGSDVHYLKHMRCADFLVTEPIVIGHECAGVVEQIGSNVKHLKVGDRVAIEPGIACGRCKECKEGFYNLCPDMKFFGAPPVNGSLATQIVHPADLCFKLPENVSLEEGAMCEPLSVGVHAVRRSGAGPDTRVMVMGAGPIGLVTMMVARAFGAPKVIIVDVDEKRLAFAKQMGADATVHVSSDLKDVDQEVLKAKAAMGECIDLAFDCVGMQKTMTTALKATRSGGRVSLIGMAQPEMTVPLTHAAAAREVDVYGCFRYRNTYPLCIELIRSGKIDVRPLITHRFGFTQKEVEEAFAVSCGRGNAIKVMFNL